MHHKTELEEKAEDLRQVDCPLSNGSFGISDRLSSSEASSSLRGQKRRGCYEKNEDRSLYLLHSKYLVSTVYKHTHQEPLNISTY